MNGAGAPSWRRYLRFFRPNHAEDLDDEIAFHLASRIEELMATGLSRQEAEAATLARLGDLARFRAQALSIDHQWERERSMKDRLDNFSADVTFALRQLRRSPAFAVAAILCFALGVGANSAIFSLVNGVLLRPLPYRDAHELVTIDEGLPKAGPGFGRITAPEYLDYRQLEGTIFQSTAIYQTRLYTVRATDGTPERVPGAAVSGAFFRLLGREPALGRVPQSWMNLAEDPTAPLGTPEVVVTHAFWRTRLGGDSTIIGKSMPFGAGSVMVAAVMPPSFQFPIGGLGVTAAEVFFPLSLTPAMMSQRADLYNTWAFGRLAKGVTVERASAAVNDMASSLPQRYPGVYREMTAQVAGRATPLRDAIVGPVRRPLLVLFGAVCLVLLIACLNVSSLLIARSVSRQREIAVRRAIGASRGRLMQQFLTESLVLVTLGGLLGLMVGRLGARALAALDPNSSLNGYDIGLDWRVVGVTMALATLTGITFSLLPGLTGRDDLQAGLREGASGGKAVSRAGLVVAEIAAALLLTVGAGLMLRSFIQLRAVDPGFAVDRVLTFRATFPESRYPTHAAAMSAQRVLTERVAALPGVEAASAASHVPLAGLWEAVFTPDPAMGPAPERTPIISVSLAHPGFFEAMGMRLLAGRAIGPSDVSGQPGVVVVSEALANRYYGGLSAVGKRFKRGPADAPISWLTIVGVVGDVKQSALADEMYIVGAYLPAAQVDTGPSVALTRGMTYVVRTNGDPGALIPMVRAAVREVDSQMPLMPPRPMAEIVAASIADRRFNMFLLGSFALAALGLAGIGIYGLIAYSVAQRTRELGIRVALGAVPRDVLLLVVRQGALLAIIGIVIGSLGAIGATRLLESMLFQVDALDPMTFGTVAVVLAAVAIGASWIPARRAARVSPVTAMRND